MRAGHAAPTSALSPTSLLLAVSRPGPPPALSPQGDGREHGGGAVSRGQRLGLGQAKLARDQAGEQGVAEGGERLGLLLIRNKAAKQR